MIYLYNFHIIVLTVIIILTSSLPGPRRSNTLILLLPLLLLIIQSCNNSFHITQDIRLETSVLTLYVNSPRVCSSPKVRPSINKLLNRAHCCRARALYLFLAHHQFFTKRRVKSIGNQTKLSVEDGNLTK